MAGKTPYLLRETLRLAMVCLITREGELVMYSSVLLVFGLGYYLFVYKGVERADSSSEGDSATVRYPETKSAATRCYMHAKLLGRPDLGDLYVYARAYPKNSLPDSEIRADILDEFRGRVEEMRVEGRLPVEPVRYIDKVDLSLDMTTVKTMAPDDAINLYKRQMRYLSMYVHQANPFESLRQLLGRSSHYRRPDGKNYLPTEGYAGNFASFIQDYYYSLYFPTRNEWNIYLARQQRGLVEIENDVFGFLNEDWVDRIVNSDGKVVTTFFSKTGLELLSNGMRPDRLLVPTLLPYAEAFTDKDWRNYFPYTWAEVNRKRSSREINRWINGLKND